MSKFNEMLFIYVPVSAQTADTVLIRVGPQPYTCLRLSAGNLFNMTVAELFQGVSGLSKTALPSQLVFEFFDVHQQRKLETSVILDRHDANGLNAAKTIAWGHFRERANLDPAVANITILILPTFPAVVESIGEKTQQQPQQPHPTYAGPNTPSYQPVSHQNGYSIASDSTYHPSITQPSGPPLPQTPSTFPKRPAPDPINSHLRTSSSGSSSTPTPNPKPTPEESIPNSNKNMMQAHVPSNPNPQQSTQAPLPTNSNPSTKTTNSVSPPPQICLRIQVDAAGHLSQRYEKSILHARTSQTQFFAWFARETGRAAPAKLRFDFKDAVPAKSSVVAAGNDDHFELMVGDLARKVARAVEFVPGLAEFCVVVTEPGWIEGGDDDVVILD
jgi:hypothetical protein